MLKRLASCMLVLLLSVALSGCAGFTYKGINELLRAPALGGDNDEIQQALFKSLGGAEPQYKYPKEGVLRSPVVRVDFDGDGDEEAVVLYSLIDLSASAGLKVHLALLERQDNIWQVVQDVEGLNTDVASIEVVELFGDGTRQLIVGFGQTNMSAKTFGVYTMKNSTLVKLMQRDYSRYDIGNFTGASSADIVVVSRYDNPGSITLEYIIAVEGQLVSGGEPVPLDANFKSCDNICPGVTHDGRYVLVVDGKMDDDRLFSQLVEYSSAAGFYTVDDSGAIRLASARANKQLFSRDINNDGMVEVPVSEGVILTPAADKRLEFVQWMDFAEPGIEPVSRQFGLVDADRSVYFQLPEKWQGILALIDGDNKGEWELQNSQTGQVLVAVRVVDVGEMPPPGAQRVLGTTNSYMLLPASLLESEKNAITMTLLN